MAVIALNGLRRVAFCLLLTGWPAPMRADQRSDVQAVLSRVASALSAGDPADAIAQFTKTYAQSEQLREYFTGLTNAYSIANEVDVTEEQDMTSESLVTIHWTLSLSDSQGGNSNRRSGEIQARLIREKTKWLIAEFSPIHLFDPAEALESSPEHPPASE